MRILLTILFFTAFMEPVTSQVGIGTTSPHDSTILHIDSTNRGLLTPRMTQMERDGISEPANGLLIFNLDIGFFEYWDSIQWLVLNASYDCAFGSTPNLISINMEKGDTETTSIYLTTSIGSPGNLTTALISTTTGFDVTINNITNNPSPTPVTQEISFTLESSSTANIGDTGSAIFQISGECGTVINIEVSITILGCDFEIIPPEITKFATIPLTGNTVVSFDIPIFQSGTNPGLATAIVNDYPGITETIINSPCGYTCQPTLELDFDNTAAPGTYVYTVGVSSSCGYAETLMLTLVISEYPKNCAQILIADPTAISGVYLIDPDGLGPLPTMNCDCDMTTAGGGWTLVLNYLHEATTDPGLQIRASSLPLVGSTILGNNEQGSAYWGHASNSMMSNLNYNEVMFYGITSEHERVMHFYTSQTAMNEYFNTGVGQVNYAELRENYVTISGHTALLPAIATTGRSNRGDAAMHNYTFRNLGDNRWNFNEASRWCMDSNPAPGGANENIPSTHHQIWVR